MDSSFLSGESRKAGLSTQAQALFLSLFAFAVLSSCGRTESPTPANVQQGGGSGQTEQGEKEPPPGVAPQFSLNLFGADWCTNCKSQFPEIQRLINALPAEKKAGFKLVLYAVESADSVAATEESAANYRDLLKLNATAIPDPWRWKTFRKWVGGTQLPGAAVTDVNGKVLRSFRAGATTFVPAEIVNYTAGLEQ